MTASRRRVTPRSTSWSHPRIGTTRKRAGGRGPDGLLRRYLPAPFLARLPEDQATWRGRLVLLLWALGYPLEMAWSLSMTADDEQARSLKDLIAPLTDERLIAQLEATAETRGDGSHLEFVSFGLIRRPPN